MKNADSNSSLTSSTLSDSSSDGSVQCIDCHKSYKHCNCKHCSLCLAPFSKIKIGSRSHCRICNKAICKSCLDSQRSAIKTCAQCTQDNNRGNKITQNILQDITKVKYGIDIEINLSNSPDNKNLCTELLSAAKRGDHHIILTLLSKNVNPNMTDDEMNTALLLAAKHGNYPCVLLLLDYKADANLANKQGWTPLHAVAWKGITSEHIQCADALIKIGQANPLNKNINNETPFQLAERVNLQNKEMIEFLHDQELRCHMRFLSSLFTDYSRQNIKIDTLKYPLQLTLSALERFIKERNAGYDLIDNYDVISYSSPAANRRCYSSLSSYSNSILSTTPRTPPATSTKQMHTITTTVGTLPATPIQATTTTTENSVLQDQISKQHKDNHKLMQSVTLQVLELDRVKQKLRQQEESHFIDNQKLQVAHENQLAKLRSDYDALITQYRQLATEKQIALDDVQGLQKGLKLTWVPDNLVIRCMNAKCVEPEFDTKNRKFHCRCCGRVFCSSCCQDEISIPTLGYKKPVRVCRTCNALTDTLLININNEAPSEVTMDSIPIKTDEQAVNHFNSHF